MLMDDNGKSELLALMTWTGCGFAAHEPGKEEDDKESPDEESKPRKGERRETKNIWAGTAKKPSEIIEGGKGYYSWCDLQGNGMFTLADDKKGGVVAFKVHKSDGSVGCSIVFDADAETIFASAGKNQMQMFGKEINRTFFTKLMIYKTEFMKVKQYWEAITKKLKERFKKYDE